MATGSVPTPGTSATGGLLPCVRTWPPSSELAVLGVRTHRYHGSSRPSMAHRGAMDGPRAAAHLHVSKRERHVRRTTCRTASQYGASV
eukprot:1157979-Prymnesium_polylepis.2